MKKDQASIFKSILINKDIFPKNYNSSIRVTAYEKCLAFLGMFNSTNNHNGEKSAGSESVIG